MTREEWLIIIKKAITDIDGLEWEAGMNGLTTTIRLNRNEAVSLYELIEKSRETDEGLYEKATEQLEHDIRYEPTYNQNDGSM